MLTSEHLCNVKAKKLMRSIKLSKLNGLTKSTDADNFDFIIHVKQEYDYEFRSKQRDELFD